MRERLAIIALAAILAAPAAAASWGAKGSLEPDTALDKSSGFMWTSADQTPLSSGNSIGSKVYFNAYVYQSGDSHFDHGTVTFNPNFATVGSAHQGWMGQLVGMLGVWKDCNKDGYIGLGDNALLVYRSELLLGSTVCPAGTQGTTKTTLVPMHNDGTWVHEFLAIGPETQNTTQNPTLDQNRMDLRDDGARMWADWGVPGAAPAPSRCYIFTPAGADPQGHPQWGTMHSTGGMLEFADCWDDYGGIDTFDRVDATADPTNAQHLSFADHPRDAWNSSSTLNRANPWGLSGGNTQANTMVGVWDCGKTQPPNGHPVAGPVAGFQVSQPKVPPTTNTGGTLAATTEFTIDGLIDCNSATDGPAYMGGKNQYSYQVANTPYSQETAGFLSASGTRDVSDFLMHYNEGQQPGATSPVVGNAGPKDGGLDDAGDSDGLWISDVTISEDRNPFVDRNALRVIDGPQNPVQKIEYITTYADISASAISTYGLSVNPTGKVGTYGVEACGTATAGIVNHWQCDPNLWYGGNCDPNLGYSCSGTIEGANADLSIRPGHAYNLLDVDCYDNSVTAARSLGVGWGVLNGANGKTC